MDGLESRGATSSFCNPRRWLTAEIGRVIVIGATNRLDTLDPALLRPGRFDRKLQFKRPNLEARKQIIDIKTAGFALDDTLKYDLASVTEGYSGADLKVRVPLCY